MKRRELAPDTTDTDEDGTVVSGFIPTGCLLLDLVLSGGYPLGRIINLVGDRSSGKTLLAVEACINFGRSTGNIKHARYVDAESAFDEAYATSLGMPEGVQLNTENEIDTVEEFFNDFGKFLEQVPKGEPCLYVLDSLDALSDSGEMDRGYEEGSYGAAKAKLLSQFFRRNKGLIARKQCALIIISQLRDNIGVRFGEKHKRSGGRALDFYASQVVWLTELKKLKKTALGMERTIGIQTRVRAKKNKMGPPHREADLSIMFNYGVDDERSMLDWLKETKAGLPQDGIEKELETARKANDKAALERINKALRAKVTEHWFSIEERLQPLVRKYE